MTSPAPVRPPAAGCALIASLLAALLFAGLAYTTGKDEGRVDPVFAVLAVIAAAFAAWTLWGSRRAP